MKKESFTCKEEDKYGDYEVEWDVPTGQFYCSRCIADVEAPIVAELVK